MGGFLDWKEWNLASVLISVFATVAALLGWEIRRMPKAKFGDPIDRAGEDTLAWWQIPIFIDVSKWYETDRLARCRISLSIDASDSRPCIWTTINGPIDTMDLIQGDEPQFVPIIARSTIEYAISGDPRFRPHIKLETGAATLTDLAALIHGSLKTLEIGRYEIQLHLLIPGKIPTKIDSRKYALEITSRASDNRNFKMF